MEQSTFTEKSFGQYEQDGISVTIRACSASVGGGSEVLVICSIPTPLEHYVQETTKA